METGIFNKRVLHSAPEFRFWHIGRQKMYIVDNFTRDGQITWWPGPDATQDEWDEACSDGLDIEDGVLMQFTGLLDCKGAKVWEGDIVYNTFEQESVVGGLLHSYCYVVFATGGFGLVAGLGGVDLESFNNNCRLDENPTEEPIGNQVVGTIYLHLDLLKRDYYNAQDDSSTGLPPPHYDPESIYTFCRTSAIGIVDEQSHLSPYDKYLMCTTIQPALLPSHQSLSTLNNL